MSVAGENGSVPSHRHRSVFRTIGMAIFVAVSCGCGEGEQGAVQGSPPENTRRPNFLFILIDDMGWMDTGYNGSRLYETPNIDRLATQGMRFTNAYAASPYCSPTRASIQTGRYPVRTGINAWIGYLPTLSRPLLEPPNSWHLGLREVTIAEVFKEAGYATGIVGKWHLGTQKYYPQHQGYEYAVATAFAQAGKYFYPYSLELMMDLESGVTGEYLTDRLADETMKIMTECAERQQPFLVFYSSYAMHSNLDAKDDLVTKYKEKLAELPPPEGPRFVREGNPAEGSGMGVAQFQENPVFAAMLESVDENVGRLLNHLEDMGVADNTVVIFFSDNGGLSTNGTAVARHGVPNTVHDTSNAPLRGGKGYLFEGGIREPLLIKWPGVTSPGSVCEEPVISTDFFPTMLDIAGLPLRPELHLDGLSLVPLLRGRSSLGRNALFWHMPLYGSNGDFPGSAVRCGDFKLIEFYEDERAVLYNLREDIRESHDLAAEMPGKVAELRSLLHDWREEVNAPGMLPNPFFVPTQ